MDEEPPTVCIVRPSHVLDSGNRGGVRGQFFYIPVSGCILQQRKCSRQLGQIHSVLPSTMKMMVKRVNYA